jgi:dTDP-4-amino-4,6-dideoxygalactose transaminase
MGDVFDHDFYILGIRISESLASRREWIADSLRAEGIINLIVGYQALHRLPSFQKFSQKNLANANQLHDHTFLGLYMCGHNFSEENISQISNAFHKVFAKIS